MFYLKVKFTEMAAIQGKEKKSLDLKILFGHLMINLFSMGKCCSKVKFAANAIK